MLVYSLRAAAAKYDIAIWTERAPIQLKQADLPPRGGEPSSAAEPSVDLALD